MSIKFIPVAKCMLHNELQDIFKAKLCTLVMCVTLGKLFILSTPQFHYLENGDKPYLQGCENLLILNLPGLKIMLRFNKFFPPIFLLVKMFQLQERIQRLIPDPDDTMKHPGFWSN